MLPYEGAVIVIGTRPSAPAPTVTVAVGLLEVKVIPVGLTVKFTLNDADMSFAALLTVTVAV